MSKKHNNSQNKKKTREIEPIVPKTENKIAIVGVFLSGFALFFDGIPGFGWILLGAAFVCSIIGLFKKPRGSAWLGLIVSIIAILPLALQIWLSHQK